MPKITFHNIPQSLQRRVRTHVGAQMHRFFAVVQPGFEHIAFRELNEAGIGTGHAVEHGGIHFSGKLSDCYRANIACRTITRVLLRIADFRVRRFAKLRELAGKIPWELFLTSDIPLTFSITAHASRLYHTDRIALECFRAVAACFASSGLSSPAWEKNASDENRLQTLYMRIADDLCTISLDSTGAPLYKRGFKLQTTEAPLRETTAAAILLEAGCKDATFFIDPMAGSGTFSLEAGMIALNIPPGLGRCFSFEYWPAYSESARRHIEKELRRKIISPHDTTFRMMVSDIDQRALESAQKNIAAAGLTDIVVFYQRDFISADLKIPAQAKALIALNPPYGRRLMDPRSSLLFYERIGAKLRSMSPLRYVVLAPNEKFEQALAIIPEKKIHFTHGGLQVVALFGMV